MNRQWLRLPGRKPRNEWREQRIRELFAQERRSYPTWTHTSLMHRVWAKRPRGATVYEVLRIAEEYKRECKTVLQLANILI